jgi:putative DNA primase/helicase
MVYRYDEDAAEELIRQAVALGRADQFPEIQDAKPDADAVEAGADDAGGGDSDGGGGGIAVALSGFALPDRLPAPTNPLGVARIVEGFWETAGGGRGLRHWRGEWWRWVGAHWADVSPDGMRAQLYPLLEGAVYLGGKEGGTELPWHPTKPKVANVMEALAAVVHVSERVAQPSWLENGEGLDHVISLANGLLNPVDRELYAHSELYFNSFSLPFAYQVDAECDRWLSFLDSVWPGDMQSAALLQEWYGYVLSGRTTLQKFLFLKGASRGGKGVIARLLGKLMGRANVAGPTFDSFATGFGLETFIGKPLAVIGDARSSAKVDMQSIIGRILSMTGEDALDINRKYKPLWSGVLPTRLMLLSNELPWFRDASGALANRMLMLVLTQTFAGREDHRLERDLEKELPAIFNWSLAGLDRLVANDGRFTVPDSSRETFQEFADAMSPVQAFVREVCVVGEHHRVPKEALWWSWQMWCAENEHQPGGKTRFMAVLRDAVPSVTGDQKMPNPDLSGQWVKCYTGLGIVG